MVASSKHISNHICKDIQVHATIGNNDGVQETFGKGTKNDANVTPFQSICEGLS